MDASTGTRSYWLDLFTGTTWQEFLDAGAEVTGFREHRWKQVQKMKSGDYLLCYLTGISRWIGILEVVGPPFLDESPIWADETFPARIRVELLAALTPETAVPVIQMRDRLSIFRDLSAERRWSGAFRGSPARWKREDGEAVVEAVFEAQRKPVERPYDKALLRRRPAAFESKAIRRDVTVPETEPVESRGEAMSELRSGGDATPHTEIQWLLLKLGTDLGMDVWVARNDRHREFDGNRFAELPRLRNELPQQFDAATNRTIELIDVLWLQGNAFAAAFEIESTTSIYSGLLRMADLLAMQPNINIPLYIVAPDDRRQKVFDEVNRPTFSRLTPPLAESCKFIAFSTLRDKIVDVAPYVQHLRADFIDSMAESCDV